MPADEKRDSDGEPRNEPERITHYEYGGESAWSFGFHVDPEEFTGFIESVGQVVDECKLQVTTDGLETRAADPSNTAIVEDCRPSVTDLGGVTTVGMNVYTLKPNLPVYATGDNYLVEVDAEADELRVMSPHGEATTRIFDPASVRDMPDIPEYDYEQTLTVPAYKWNGAVGSVARALENSEIVELNPMRCGALSVMADPDRIDTVLHTAAYGWSLDWMGAKDGEKGAYSADFLVDITEGLPDDGEFTVKFGEEQPLRVEGDGIQYMQAPRILDGDDDE